MRWLFRTLAGLAVVLAVLLLGIGGWALLPARTAPIPGSDAIATLERVSLGGQEQTILIRGHDRAKPVLLYVHGGPGFAHLPLAPLYGDALEHHFVVVHWDQRGAGAKRARWLRRQKRLRATSSRPCCWWGPTRDSNRRFRLPWRGMACS
jgi:pimeloyl-ACP methyl ester carboxylesterase